MAFIDDIKIRAKEKIKTIVLPEATDIRVLTATSNILKEGFAKIILIGNKEAILNKAKESNLDLENAEIVDPVTSEKYDEYVPVNLIKKGFAYGVLDIQGMLKRIQNWKKR